MFECPLKSAAREEPDLAALEAPGARLTFAELNAAVEETASRLAGIERVAFQGENSADLVVGILGAIRAGGAACPLSTRLPAGAARAQAESIGARFPEHSPREGRAQEPWPDQAATILFTSGSSASPRAALHTFANHLYSAAGSNENIPVVPGDRWLLSLPLYHVGGLGILFRCLLGRATVVLSGPDVPLGDAITGLHVSHVSMVATQLRRCLGELRGHRLRAILLGGSAVPLTLIEDAHAAGLPIHTSYGLTEMASQVTTTRGGAPLAELRSSGRVLAYRQVRISAEGEILVRGETRFAGYVSGRGLQQPFDEEGWFATRDAGSIDEKGLLHVAGRMDNMFISGGENVMPEEVEKMLEGIGGVLRAVVVPVPDEEFGSRPVAFIEGDVDPSRLRDALLEILPRFKVPDRYFRWPSGEETASMKVDRAWFRKKANDLLTRED